jgi:hypothetical protein
MSKVSDSRMLALLEYRGVDDFLSEMEVGLVVPTCFVERVKALIKENYDIVLVAKPGMLDNLHEGEFCGMPYNDTSVTLVSSY